MRKKGFGQRGGGATGGRVPGGGSPYVKPRRIEMRFPEARGELDGKDDDRQRSGRARPAKSGFKPRRDDRSERPDAKSSTPWSPRGPQRPVGSGRPTEEMRIAKAMARSGLCSRRDAERWIAEGRVQVNGETLTSPARDVGPKDRVLVDGLPLPDAEPVRLWRYHKPRGLVTTHKDPEGRPTVFDMLPKELGRVISIGRLDFNTEGLLLLTNDGALARYLELPATGWLRKYRVRAHGVVTQAQLDALKDGAVIDGVAYGPIEATLDSVQGANAWLTIGLREGKNREVRNILGSLNLTVNRLIRISYGPFQLLDLDDGAVESVKRRVLAEQLGPTLATQFGIARADDDAPRAGKASDKKGSGKPHPDRERKPHAEMRESGTGRPNTDKRGPGKRGPDKRRERP